MHVMILGGTGMLVYATALELLRAGHQVSATARHTPHFGQPFEAVKLHLLDVAQASSAELQHLFAGVEAVIYALGPDDRESPPAPALPFFRKHLAEQTRRIALAARAAGVKKFVVYGSYFNTFDRQHPEWQLQAHHPYIQARHEQAEQAIEAGAAGQMDVCILEIPYVFGVTPDRKPFWNEVLFDRLVGQKVVLFPKGGTAVTTTQQVAEAALGAVERGKHGGRYVVADLNMDWNTMIAAIQTAAGEKLHVWNVPPFLAQLGMQAEQKKLVWAGKEGGLHPNSLMPDIMYRSFYLDPQESRAALGYSSGGVGEAIRETVAACSPKA